MRFHRFRRAAFSAALASPLAFLSAAALANEPLEVKSGETVVLDGTVHFQTIVVRGGGKIVVRPLTMNEPGTGTLTIKADAVTVEKDGLIDATGAGFESTTIDGKGASLGTGGKIGKTGSSASPGGGGGSGGKGANGCPGGGDGGAAYAPAVLPNPGASGGPSFFPNSPDVPNRGGRGGGSLFIHAAKVQVDGAILADGAPGLSYGGVGTGGGAGGYISIEAVSILGTGTVAARGGKGGDGFSANGGGGGGGTIQVTVTLALMMNDQPVTLVNGGLTGTAMDTCGDGDAGIAEVNVDMNKPCIDADGDGEGSVECGGQDCDDSDPTVYGGTNAHIEICDGQDNDCDKIIDNDLVKDACPAGQACQSGACTETNAATSGGSTSTNASPDYLDYRGACDVGTSPHRNGMVFFGAALVAFLAGLRAQRRRRP